VFKLNRRVTVRRYTGIKNEFGGLIPVQTASWSKWADIVEQAGSNVNNYQQGQWSYDTTITMRYEKARPTKSNDVIEYDSNTYKINSIAIETEGAKSWEKIKVTKLDDNINSDAPVDTDSIKILNYVGVGGEVSFTNSLLIGKNIFAAFKDGIQQVIVTGTPVGKEVSIDIVTGEVVFGIQFETGEIATILYY
jgi:hypothetical protein